MKRWLTSDIPYKVGELLKVEMRYDEMERRMNIWGYILKELKRSIDRWLDTRIN